MIRLLVIFFITIFQTSHLWASDYDGNYKCEPTFVLTENYLLIANGIDYIQVLVTNQNQGIDLGLVDENKLEKIEMTLEDFIKFKTTEFRKHSFEMKIYSNTGQIIQPGHDEEVDTYFETVLVGKTDSKILMGYTEYGSKTRSEEYWWIRDFVLMDTWDDTLKNTKTIDFLDEEEKRKVIYSLVRNMLKNLATYSGSWIEISQSEIPGTLNFSAKNAGLLLNYNVDDTEIFRAVCKII